jgi:hypothetical protein
VLIQFFKIIYALFRLIFRLPAYKVDTGKMGVKLNAVKDNWLVRKKTLLLSGTSPRLVLKVFLNATLLKGKSILKRWK